MGMKETAKEWETYQRWTREESDRMHRELQEGVLGRRTTMDKESASTRAALRKIVDNQKGSDRLILTKREVRSLFPRLEQVPERMVTEHGEFEVLDSGERGE